MKRFHILTIGIFLFSAIAPVKAHASNLEREIPPGFKEIASDVGITLYRKNYSGGSPDFVQIVDFSQGAALVLLHGDVEKVRAGKGMFGGNDPRLYSKSLAKYWKSLKSNYQNSFCVSNGQFFYMPEYPTRLPFSLKVDGEIISDGYGYDHHVGDQLILEIWDDHLDINELTRESLYSSSAPNILAGLTEDGKKQKKRYTGRTFVGVDDLDQDGSFETLMIFNSKTARQIDASNVLKDFGADKLMMLDGGGSTQLICNGNSYIASERIIPQAIGVLAGGSEPAVEVPSEINEQVDELPSVEPISGSTQSSTTIQGIAFLPIVGSSSTESEIVSQNELGISNLEHPDSEVVEPTPLYSSSGLADILLIPLTMSPVLAILILVISRTRYQVEYSER